MPWLRVCASGVSSGGKKKDSGEPNRYDRAGLFIGIALILLYIPFLAALFSLATIGFFAERKAFLLIVLIFTLAGVAQKAAGAVFRSVALRSASAFVLTCVVAAALPRFAGAPAGFAFSPAVRFLACALIFLTILSGAEPFGALTDASSGKSVARRSIGHAKLFLFLIAMTALAAPQMVHPKPGECATLSDDGEVNILFDSYRAFSVLTSWDAKHLYVGFDYGEKIFRLPLGGAEDKEVKSIKTGRFGTVRFRQDASKKRLYVPVIGDYPNNRLAVVDESDFSIMNQSPTPKGVGYRIFDMALDKAGGQALLLGRSANVLFHKFGEDGYYKIVDLAEAFPGKELLGHKIMRIEVNERNRRAYICPYPSLGSPSIMAELDLETSKIARTVEFESHPTVVRAINGGAQLLVGLLLSEKVLLLDSDTLKTIKSYPAGFSVRDIAVDESQGLMAVGNFLTGTVNLIDLDSGRAVRNWKVGRGVRSVDLDARIGSAFAASLCGAVEMKEPIKRRVKE